MTPTPEYWWEVTEGLQYAPPRMDILAPSPGELKWLQGSAKRANLAFRRDVAKRIFARQVGDLEPFGVAPEAVKELAAWAWHLSGVMADVITERGRK